MKTEKRDNEILIPEPTIANYLHIGFIYVIYIGILLGVIFGEFGELTHFVTEFSTAAVHYK